MYIQVPQNNKQLQLIISWVLDDLKKLRFWHLIQHRQGFFETEYQILTISGLSAARPQCRNIFAVRFLAKQFHYG
jgi:hypothetical protein